jgi:enterochelin esterase-like enzyme
VSRTLLLLLLVVAGTACSGSTGRFTYADVHSEAEGRKLRYGVYLPPGWDGARPLPIVVLLHGAGDDATSADRRVVVDALDEAIASGELRPFIMVTPEGDLGFWVDWHDGSHRWRTWVLDEVVPRVRERYPTIDGPAGLHLVGVSMGGGGGMQMWLREPARFGSATILSAPILDEADTRAFLQRFLPPRVLERAFGRPGSGAGTDPYVALSSASALHGSRLIFGAARNDRGGILRSNEDFHRHLTAAGVPHRFLVFRGGHGWRTWSRVFPFALCHQLEEACKMQVPSIRASQGA